MAASSGRTEASAVNRKLDPIVNQLTEITNYFNSMQTLVDDEILTQEEVDEVVNAYKAGVQAQMAEIQAEEAAHGEEVGVAGQIERSDAIEGIVPVATNGSPVIAPLPAIFAAEKVTLLSDQPALEASVEAKIAQINDVVG